MENRSHALIAGVFTLLLALSAVMALWWFGGKNEDTRSYLVVTTKSLTGLNSQAQVRYRGVRVGRVEQIDLDASDIRNTLIRIRIRSDIPVTEGTVAKLGFQGVTGLAHVQLEDSGENPQRRVSLQGELPRIPMRDSFVQEFAETGADTLRNVRELVIGINQLLNPENRLAIARTLANLEETSGNARDAAVQLKQLLAPENVQHLRTVLHRAEQVAGQTAPFISEARGLVARWHDVTDKFDQVLGDPLTGGSAALIPGVNQLTGDIASTSRQLSRVLQVLEESPQSLLFGGRKAAPGPGEIGFIAPPERKD